MKYDFDFERAATLMNFVVEAGKHGPTYNVMMGMAQEELKDMLDEAGLMVKRLKDVTPPAGPANAAVAEVSELAPGARSEPFVMKDTPVPIFPPNSGTKVDPPVPSEPSGEVIERRSV